MRRADRIGSRVACLCLPEVAGDEEPARACGVDVGAGGEGAGGEVGGAALEEEAAALESARGGELGGENAELGGLDLLLGLRIKGKGGKRRRGEAGGARVWRVSEREMRGFKMRRGAA